MSVLNRPWYDQGEEGGTQGMEMWGEWLKLGSREKYDDDDDFGKWARKGEGRVSSIRYMSDKDCATYCRSQDV